MLRLKIIAAAFFTLVLGSCHHGPRNTETDLYFGLSKPDGGIVTDSDWQRFEREEIMRILPKGFTVIPANGVWKGTAGMVSEHTMLVISLNSLDDSLSGSIDSLRERYKSVFGQESVMRVDKDVRRWDF